MVKLRNNVTCLTSRPTGLSLLELMVVLAIMATLALIVTPGLSGFIHGNQATSAANSLLTQLQLTRSEAVKRSTVVTLCHSTDQKNCTTSNIWAGSLLIHHADKLVSVVDIEPTLNITTAPALTSLSFNSVGAASQAVTFIVQRQRYCFDVEVQLSGRVEVRRRSCSNA